MRITQLLKFIGAGLLALSLVLACSSGGGGSTGPGGNYSFVEFADFTEIARQIAPQPYENPAQSGGMSAPLEIDSIWFAGEEAILNKVLGEEHSTSLFSYLETFDQTIMELETVLQVDDSGNLLADSSWVQVYDLSSPTTIPSQAQAVIGTSVDLEQYVNLAFPTSVEGHVTQIGFTRNSQEEIVLLFNHWPQGAYGYNERSFLYYARLDLSDSSIVIKAVDYKSDGDEVASHLLDIHSVDDSDFSYRMTWLANSLPEPDSTMLGCIVGGGNRSSEFALKYRQKIPAHASEYDTSYASEQVFNADYSESTSLISSYDQFVNDNLIIPYSAVPTTFIQSPWQD